MTTTPTTPTPVSLAQIATNATNATWLPVIKAALISTAITVATEPVTTINHPARYAFAQKVLFNADAYVNQIAWMLAAIGFSDTSTDAELLGNLEAEWNAFANF